MKSIFYIGKQSAQWLVDNIKKLISEYKDAAETAATTAENYAIGKTNSSKYYYEQSKLISEEIAGTLRAKGTIAFADLPALSVAKQGDMYNISDSFITTEDFKEGAGNVIPLGANVYKTDDEKWDILAGTPVTGIKGNSENTYRKGNVNITPTNIGLGNVGNYKAVSTVASQSLSDKEKLNARNNIEAFSSMGGILTGNISYKGTKATFEMIKFIDNVVDANGNGIAIGGGGATIIGGGESANILSNTNNGVIANGGTEKLVLGSDNNIEFYTNCNNGIDSAKKISMNEEGEVVANGLSGSYLRLQKTGGPVILEPVAPITASRTISIPNNSGTMALTTDLDGYLNKSGGSMSGNLTIGLNNKLFINTSRYIVSKYLNGVEFLSSASDTSKAGFVMWINTGNGNDQFTPTTSGGSTLGTSSVKWGQIYSTNSTISTSDKREKKEISYIGQESNYNTKMTDDQLKKFINGLLPCIYQLKDGTSGRPHHGLIAQDIEKLMDEIGISDHAAFIKSPKLKEVEVEKEIEEKEVDPNTGENTIVKKAVKEMQYEEIPEEYIYSLRYEEFIADIIRFVQLQNNRLDNLEERLEKLEKFSNK